MMVVLAVMLGSASPVEVTQIPEMDPIAALEAKASDRQPPMPAVPAAFATAWRAVEPRVQAQLTPAVVRELSRWAKPQMATYTKTPAVKGATFSVARAAADGALTLSATLDTLPSHSPLVTRWLQVIATFDPPTGKIGHVWITIRGEVQE